LFRIVKRPASITPDLAGVPRADGFAEQGTGIIYEPMGCSKCRGTGYAGRIAVAELLAPTRPRAA
jgi:type II secretory ATPase GspE/PulE/Tfp pilus assembly ATPase PilB-like protein